jgi:hypothetical protein
MHGKRQETAGQWCTRTNHQFGVNVSGDKSAEKIRSSCCHLMKSRSNLATAEPSPALDAASKASTERTKPFLHCPVEGCNVLYRAPPHESVPVTSLPCGHTCCGQCDDAASCLTPKRCWICSEVVEGTLVNTALASLGETDFLSHEAPDELAPTMCARCVMPTLVPTNSWPTSFWTSTRRPRRPPRVHAMKDIHLCSSA